MGATEVLVLDDLHRSYSRDSLPTTVEFRRSYIRDPGAVADALNGSEIVFHLAAQSNVTGAVTTRVTPLAPTWWALTTCFNWQLGRVTG